MRLIVAHLIKKLPLLLSWPRRGGADLASGRASFTTTELKTMAAQSELGRSSRESCVIAANQSLQAGWLVGWLAIIITIIIVIAAAAVIRPRSPIRPNSGGSQ